MCFFPMVINPDGIKLNGVTVSTCSPWCSFLAMVELLRYRAPPPCTNIQQRVWDHLLELVQLVISKPTEILGYFVVRHTEVPKDIMRTPRNPGRRCILSDIV